MSAVTTKSTVVTNLGAPENLIPPNNQNVSADVMDVVTIGTNNTIGDIYLMMPVGSNKTLNSLKYYADQLDTNVSPTITLDIGLANGPTGFWDNGTYYAPYAAISATLFASASTAGQAAVTTGTELAGKVASHASEMLKALWDRAGLSADPKVQFLVQVKLHAAAATAATSPTVVLVGRVLGAN